MTRLSAWVSAHEGVEAADARHLDQGLEQHRAEPLVLAVVGHQEGDLGPVVPG